MRLHPFFLSHRFLVIGLLLAPVMAHAQESGSIRGIVRDAKTQAPLVGAIVVLRDASDTTARPLGGQTDRDGAFVVERVPFGRTFIPTVRYIGYTSRTLERITLVAPKKS